jgi:hypothetical protein
MLAMAPYLYPVQLSGDSNLFMQYPYKERYNGISKWRIIILLAIIVVPRGNNVNTVGWLTDVRELTVKYYSGNILARPQYRQEAQTIGKDI